MGKGGTAGERRAECRCLHAQATEEMTGLNSRRDNDGVKGFPGRRPWMA